MTSQRILWLEKIREDVSKIVGLSRLIFFNSELIQNFATVRMWQMISNSDFKGSNGEDIVFNEFKSKFYDNGKNISELLQLITKLKLRLNYEEDKDLIDLLKQVEEGIINNIDKNYISEILDEITLKSQRMLRKEWRKVKKEVIAGKEDK